MLIAKYGDHSIFWNMEYLNSFGGEGYTYIVNSFLAVSCFGGWHLCASHIYLALVFSFVSHIINEQHAKRGRPVVEEQWQYEIWSARNLTGFDFPSR